MELWFWVAVAVVMAVAEAATVQLVSLWFIAGAVAAIVATLLGAPIWLQVVLFAAVSGLLLILLRPLLRRQQAKHVVRTNIDALSGKHAVVTERIDNLHATGRVKLDGNDWTARSVDDTVIEPGTEVVIRSVEGVKTLVEAVSRASDNQ